MRTKKGTIKWIGKRKYIVKSNKKTGKNTYTTVWKEVKKNRKKT